MLCLFPFELLEHRHLGDGAANGALRGVHDDLQVGIAPPIQGQIANFVDALIIRVGLAVNQRGTVSRDTATE
jgi:hypothetical protein